MAPVNVQSFFENATSSRDRLDDLLARYPGQVTLVNIVEEIAKRAMIPVRFKEEVIGVFVQGLVDLVEDEYDGDVAEWLSKPTPAGA